MMSGAGECSRSIKRWQSRRPSKRIRLNLGADWKIYSAHDIELLKYILGECWGSLDRRKWEQVTFTRLSKDAVDAIIRVAKEVKREERLESDAIQEVIGLLQRIP
jgi:hypothetical protein